MISRANIEAADDTLDEIAVASLISIVRTTVRYLETPAYFSDIEDRITEIQNTVKAQQLNAALNELELLGPSEVEINQAQTVGTDGLVYRKSDNRMLLVDYVLGVLYEGFSFSVYPTDEDNLVLRGSYGVGRLPLEYEGYL